MGSSSTTKTSQKNDPWAPAQGNLRDILSKASSQSGDLSNFTPTFSNATQQGIQGLIDAAGQPNTAQSTWNQLAQTGMQGYGTGASALERTASGGMLGGNPYLNSVLDATNQRTADQVKSQMAGYGRFGDNAATVDAMTRAIGQNEMNARMGNYNTERTNQLNAAGLLNAGGQAAGSNAASAMQAGLAPATLLGQAGAAQDAQAAAVRQAPLNATNYEAGLTVPIAGLGGTSNGTSTTTTPMNIGGMIGGAAMTGLGLMTGNPMMAMGGIGNMAGGASGGGMMMPQSSWFGGKGLFG